MINRQAQGTDQWASAGYSKVGLRVEEARWEEYMQKAPRSLVVIMCQSIFGKGIGEPGL